MIVGRWLKMLFVFVFPLPTGAGRKDYAQVSVGSTIYGLIGGIQTVSGDSVISALPVCSALSNHHSYRAFTTPATAPFDTMLLKI